MSDEVLEDIPSVVESEEDEAVQVVCAACGNAIEDPEDDAVIPEDTNGEPHCIDCAATCVSCEDWWRISVMERVESGGLACPSCLSSEYSYVLRTGEYVDKDDVVYLEDVDENEYRSYAEQHCFCGDDGYFRERPDSWVDDEDEDNGPHEPFSYGTDVLGHCAYDAKRIREGALVFGVELEMESYQSSQSELVELLEKEADRHILKEDGSLHCGVELVTIPLTLDEHRDIFGWAEKLAKVASKARSGQGVTSCGMHVHINRRALSPLVMGKMLVFLNEDSTSRLVAEIAQRGPNSYCEKKKKKFTDGRHLSDSRYEALNLTNHTAEVRIFRGNLKPERVLKNVEFCHALVNYCRATSIREVARPDLFLRFVSERKRDYPALAQFLKDRNQLPLHKGVSKCA